MAALVLLLGAAAPSAWAQYKIVGPDGSVTYTDRPPAGAGAQAKGSGSSSSGAGALPFEVRQAAARYPVSLYATRSCAPCDEARQWLKGHAIPFTEYSIDRPVDAVALKDRFGDTQLPVVSIGAQVVRGFSAAEVQGYLEAAGYPRQTRLAGYAWPTPVPLAPPAQAIAAPAPPAAVAPTVAAVPSPASSAPPPKPRTTIQF